MITSAFLLVLSRSIQSIPYDQKNKKLYFYKTFFRVSLSELMNKGLWLPS